MDDTREVLLEHLPQLTFDLPLYKLLDNGDGVERAGDVYVLQRVGLEDERNPFLL